MNAPMFCMITGETWKQWRKINGALHRIILHEYSNSHYSEEILFASDKKIKDSR